MKKILILGLILLANSKVFGNLQDYLTVNDKRFNSFFLAKELIKSRNLTTWVETGTSRHGDKNCAGDGCSTMIFTDYLIDCPGEIFSVDIDQKAVDEAKQALRYSLDKVHFCVGDSVAFLKEFNKQIDFLYLDSYDYDIRHPQASQIHHLNEIVAAYDKLHENSVVMIDDCDLPRGGKGKLVVQFLLEKGWIIIHNGYQKILVKNV